MARDRIERANHRFLKFRPSTRKPRSLKSNSPGRPPAHIQWCESEIERARICAPTYERRSGPAVYGNRAAAADDAAPHPVLIDQGLSLGAALRIAVSVAWATRRAGYACRALSMSRLRAH